MCAATKYKVLYEKLPESHDLKYFFLKIFIYLFMRDTERERGRDTGRGRSRLHAGSLMWDSNPGLQDHALGQRQVPNRWATRDPHLLLFLRLLFELLVIDRFFLFCQFVYIFYDYIFYMYVKFNIYLCINKCIKHRILVSLLWIEPEHL